jgi:hypothetical protein
MKNTWSDEARIMLHPLTTYRQVTRRAGNGRRWLLFRRPLFVAFILGTFISLTVSGHLSVPLILEGIVFWSFIPILQGLLVTGLVLAFARGQMPIPKAIDFFFMGHGPVLLWMLAICGSCLFFPLKQVYLWPTESGWIMPLSLLGVWLWSNVTSFAFFRAALNLTTLRATALLTLYTVMLWGIIVSYLFAVESLQLHRLKF